MDPQTADARNLVVLLYLRNLRSQLGLQLTITTQMNDPANQKIARGTDVTDFVIRSHIVNLMLTQITENPLLAPIFEDILDADGSEIYLKSATRYVPAGQPCTIAQLVVATSRL